MYNFFNTITSVEKAEGTVKELMKGEEEGWEYKVFVIPGAEDKASIKVYDEKGYLLN